MKNFCLLSPGLILAGTLFTAAPASATVHTLVDSDGSVILSGATGWTRLEAGDTCYFGLPYGGTWAHSGSSNSMEVTSYFLAAGGTGTISMNFYADDGTGLAPAPVAPLGGFSAGSAPVADAAGGPLAAEVKASITYAATSGNPFGSYTGTYLWLGITNTGNNPLSYATGFVFGFPSPTYTFDGPFDPGATASILK